MNKKLLSVVAGTFIACSLFGQTMATDLFISEYCEWNHNAVTPQTYNHYIEIYNGTGDDVDMTKYQLWRSKNGDGWGMDGETEVDPLSLEGTLANGGTFVIARPVEDPSEVTADMRWDFLNISGDDAVGLAKDDGTGTFVLIDVIGEPDNDPGSGWDVGDSIAATINHTLIRKADVGSPTTDWAASAGTSADNSQWIVKAENDTLDVNMHTSDFTGVVPSKISDIRSNQNLIYPTINDGAFFYKSNSEDILSVYDIMGRNISSIKVNTGVNAINLDIINGIYFIVAKNNTSVTRIVVKK